MSCVRFWPFVSSGTGTGPRVPGMFVIEVDKRAGIQLLNVGYCDESDLESGKSVGDLKARDWPTGGARPGIPV